MARINESWLIYGHVNGHVRSHGNVSWQWIMSHYTWDLTHIDESWQWVMAMSHGNESWQWVLAMSPGNESWQWIIITRELRHTMNVLQCVAVCCNVLQCVIVCYSASPEALEMNDWLPGLMTMTHTCASWLTRNVTWVIDSLPWLFIHILIYVCHDSRVTWHETWVIAMTHCHDSRESHVSYDTQSHYTWVATHIYEYMYE